MVLALGRDRWEGGEAASVGEVRDGVSLTNLDQPLFEGAEATKRDLVDYLDAVADSSIAEWRDRREARPEARGEPPRYRSGR